MKRFQRFRLPPVERTGPVPRPRDIAAWVKEHRRLVLTLVAATLVVWLAWAAIGHATGTTGAPSQPTASPSATAAPSRSATGQAAARVTAAQAQAEADRAATDRDALLASTPGGGTTTVSQLIQYARTGSDATLNMNETNLDRQIRLARSTDDEHAAQAVADLQAAETEWRGTVIQDAEYTLSVTAMQLVELASSTTQGMDRDGTGTWPQVCSDLHDIDEDSLPQGQSGTTGYLDTLAQWNTDTQDDVQQCVAQMTPEQLATIDQTGGTTDPSSTTDAS